MNRRFQSIKINRGTIKNLSILCKVSVMGIIEGVMNEISGQDLCGQEFVKKHQVSLRDVS
jgi:hypothetical protein